MVFPTQRYLGTTEIPSTHSHEITGRAVLLPLLEFWGCQGLSGLSLENEASMQDLILI